MTDELIRDLGLANGDPGCVECHGLGVRLAGHHKRLGMCSCALRRICRQVLDRYIHAVTVGLWNPRVVIERLRRGGFAIGNKHAEFAADVVLIARRTLDDWHFQVFKTHFLEGREWRDCLPILAAWVRVARAAGRTDVPTVNRGTFFHSVYRLERQLGRAFAHTEPYPVFPPKEYYRGKSVRMRQIPRPAGPRVPTHSQALAMGAA